MTIVACEPLRRLLGLRASPSSSLHIAMRDVLLQRHSAARPFGMHTDGANRVRTGPRPLRRHDWIVAINGVRLAGDVRRELQAYQGRGVVLTVVRFGSPEHAWWHAEHLDAFIDVWLRAPSDGHGLRSSGNVAASLVAAHRERVRRARSPLERAAASGGLRGDRGMTGAD